MLGISRIGRIIKIIKITDFSREKILEDAIKLTRFFAGQAINTLELYKPKGKQWNEYETRMVKTLYELQGRVDKGDLLFSAIVETYNKKLPENLRKEPKSISTLLEKSFDLHTHKGTDNVTFLIWEESKIRKIFSRMIDNLGNFDNSSYPTNSQHLPSRTTLTSLTQENGNPAIHSEACDCPECAPAVLEEASSFELIGKPVNADGVTIQKARSRAGVIIYMVQELKNGRQATRWAYPSDREYSKIAETHEENQPL